MARGSAFDLSADEIVRAAVGIFAEQGLDAVSMRTVATRLGVSPVPLYSRVGNKEALLDAIADRVLADVAPAPAPGEPWQAYTMRWARALRDRLIVTRDIRRLLGVRRTPYLAPAHALVGILRSAGFTSDAATESCQLVTWATVGFAVLEPGSTDDSGGHRHRTGPPGGDHTGISKRQADHLFELHIGYIVQGLERDAAPARSA